MRQFLLFLLILGIFISPCMASQQLDEANTKFTYNGNPIHPFVIREFSNWLSDNRPPMITTVDVAAAFGANKYQDSKVKKRDNWWFAESEGMDGDVRLHESFGYHWIGRLANGAHVLETGSSGGGSGFFMDLMFVKFSEGEIFWENKKEKQLLMTIVGTYSLGDRYEGGIKINGNKVFIPASADQRGGGSNAKDIELEFPNL
jgi:predicted butyrate kinase (DUF1464 family)